MSHPVHEAINLAEPPGMGARTGHPPQSGQNNLSQGVSEFVDGSGPLFSMYLQMAAEEDKKMTDNWKADADGILIFTGLFSAAVATLVAVSVQDLKPSSQDISSFYLANIYQILANSNGSLVLIPSTLPDPSMPFSPPNSAVWVNSLWFLSLVIGLTCALLATLLQQWARQYMKITQTRYSPHKRARIRAFFAEGVDKLHLPWAVEALPALLHLSLFLFFAGLAVFLFNINHTVFNVVASWVGLCTAIYTCITLMPMFRHDSPYYAPLSSSAWYLYTGTLFAVFGIFRWITHRRHVNYFNRSVKRRARTLWCTYRRRISQGMEKEFEETALKTSSEIDGRALMWTYESLDEDHELEHFFAGIPGFCSSTVVVNPQSSLAKLDTQRTGRALKAFLERTWSSTLVSETIKTRRLVICVRAIDAAHLSHAAWHILHLFLAPQRTLMRSVEIGHSLIRWGDNIDQKSALCTQGIIADIVANVSQRNDRWFSLTMRHLGISEHVLRGYLDHGDSILLANLIHLTRQLLRNIVRAHWEAFAVARYFLPQASSFHVQNTLPGLQRNFCDLWNEIVLQARANEHELPLYILQQTRFIYLALHRRNDAISTTIPTPTHDFSILDQSSSYPLCSIPSHRSDSASDLNEFNDAKTVEMTHAPIITSPAPLHHDAVSPVIQPVATYDAPTSPRPKLDHTILHPADEPSPHQVPDLLQRITPVTPSFYPSPLDYEGFSEGAAAGPIQSTANHSIVSSMVGPIGCPYPSGDSVPRHIGNTTTTFPPSSIPNAVPLPIPILTVSSADHAAPHIPADQTINQSDCTPHDGCQ